MENIESRVVIFPALRNNIFESVESFCKDFEICFDEQKEKTKNNIFLFFCIKEFLNFVNSNNIKNPILLYDKTTNDKFTNLNLNKLSKTLVIPVFYYENIHFSKGFFKELSIKADIYEEKNTFSVKKLRKHLIQFSKLENDILKFKMPFKFLNPSCHQLEEHH
jgi:hypothetical protein